jgi:outer membrane protein assembly factor BamB
VVGDGIVVTCGGGGIWAVNAADGTLRFSNAAYPCTADPTIANGVIYEPQNGHVTMFDEYGDVLGHLGTGGAAGPPTVVDGSVYVSESLSGVDRFSIPAPERAARRPDLVQLHPDLTLKP